MKSITNGRLTSVQQALVMQINSNVLGYPLGFMESQGDCRHRKVKCLSRLKAESFTRQIREVSRLGSGALRNMDRYLLAGHMEKKVEWPPERKERWLVAVKEAK